MQVQEANLLTYVRPSAGTVAISPQGQRQMDDRWGGHLPEPANLLPAVLQEEDAQVFKQALVARGTIDLRDLHLFFFPQR